MWLLTNFGFFSVVEKPGDKGKGTLTIRGRVKADLDQLRSKYIPSLGPTVADAGSDYKYRASASRADLAAAAHQMISDIDYSNFKSSVAKKQGGKREKIYHELWHSLNKLEDVPSPAEAKPSQSKPPKPSKSELPLSFGGVVLDFEDRVLLRKPKGEFDGYVWTFPKGRPEPDELPEQTAVREVSEETGCLAKPLAAIPDTFRGGTTENRYFLMRAIAEAVGFQSDETQEVRWATFEEAKKLIEQTRNKIGRERDLSVLAHAHGTYIGLLDGSIKEMGRERKTASPGDWQTHPMPDSHVSGPFSRAFTEDEMTLIRKGIIPQAMEEKWFICFADNRLCFFRSWSGFCLYAVEFGLKNGRHEIEQVAINRDTDQYSETDIDYDLRILNFLIDAFLLERDVPFPMQEDLSPEQAAIRGWSMFGRASL